MPDEQWDKVGALLEEVLARPVGERNAFLQDRCDDATLREEVASLVEDHEEAPSFFDDLDVSALALMLLEENDEEAPEEEAPVGWHASDPLELEGRRIGRYVVEEHLGGGGMGVVYRARDTQLGRPVALKFLPPRLRRSDEAEERFLREARAAAALDHPGIATVHEIEHTEAGRPFIAMAYYAGETLKEKLAREEPLPVDEAVGYAAQIAEALRRAHAVGIVHRDVKPANVIITERGEVKLVDFGLAHVAETTRLTRPGRRLGTAAYMSPEQARGEAVDGRADLWALGVLLYEMLAGERPFQGERETAVLHGILHEEPKGLRAQREEIPVALEQVSRRCLQKDREERYGSAEALLEDLQVMRSKEHSGTDATWAAPPLRRALSAPRRSADWRPRWLVGGGAVLAVLLFVLGWALWPTEPASNEGSAADSAPATAGTSSPSIAVLPFESIGSGEDDGFTEGIHGDILTRLANVSGLKVISRTSVQQYRKAETPTSEIGEELGAGWVLEGEVQEAGGTVQVNARLINARTDQQAWAREYERALTAENLFAIQEEITRDIADALHAELTAGERERITGAPTEDLQAYRLYVQGRQRLAHVAFSRPEILTEAVPYFRRAVERDSSFALAWVGLADAAAYVDYYKTYLGWPDTLDTPPVDKEEAARMALELDPNLAEAHASMGLIHLVNGDAPAAARQLQKAIDLKPSYWEAHQWLGYLYLIIGRAQEAVGHLELALELNPEHAFARHWLYDAYLAAGEAETSLEEARRQQRLGLEEVAAIAGEVRALYRLERFEEARRIAQEQVAGRGPETTWGAWFRAYLVGIHAAEGDTASARKYLDQLRDADLPTLGMLAWAYAGLDGGQALTIYQRLDETDWRRIGPSHQFRYGTGTDLERLRTDPRYEELLQKANRAWGLNPDGSTPEDSAASLSADPETDA